MKIKTRMMVLISILLMISISCQMAAELLPSGGSDPGSFTAAATSPISVQLTWSGVEGAQKYLIERNDGQTDYFPLGELPGETIAFEDFLVPSNTQVSYRIKTVTASGTSGGKTVSLTTPRESPNPLTVAALFDTQNAHSQAIGPDGGSLSISDSRGVRYTLDIPAGALEHEVTLTLSTIQNIRGLPLSGGMTSGVRIEPEGLVFDQSATLSIETSQPDAADEMIDVAFAFDGEGSEFHFVPGSPVEATSAVFKRARPASRPWKMIYVRQPKSYGSGNGTSKDIRDQVQNHAPSSPSDNLNQEMAAANDADLLTPLVDMKVLMATDAVLLYTGREVELAVAGATDWLEFTIALDSFKSWLEAVDAQKNTLKKDEMDKREEAIWEELVNDAKVLLDKAAQDCKKSPYLAAAKRLVNQLLSGQSPFYRKFAQKMHKYSYQESALRNIKAKLDRCTSGYRVDGPFGETHIVGVICSLDAPFTLKWDSSVGLAGTVSFSPSTENGGTWNLEGALASGGVTNAGAGNYTVASNIEGTPTAIVLQGTASQTTVGYGTISSPFSETVQLHPNDCDQP